MNPLVPVSFNGGYYFTWKKVQGTTTTLLASGNTMTSFPAIAKAAMISDSGTYYLITQDGASATKCKDSVKIVIRINEAPANKALIQSSQEFCLLSSATPLTELRPSSGATGGPLSYQWYSTKDTTGIPVLKKIPAASTGISYDPGAPLETNYYVRKDSLTYCAAVQTNFLKVRVNNKPILDSIHPTVNDTLCENFTDQFQLKAYLDSLTAGKESINGGYYFIWKKVQQTTTELIAEGIGMTSYPAARRPVVEDDSGTYYLIVQDGIGATTCLDSMLIHIAVFKNCIAISCSKPDAVSIKVAASSSNNLCTGTTLLLQKDVLTFPAAPPTFGYLYSWVRTNTLGSIVVQGPSATYEDLTVNAVSAIDSGRYELVVQDGAASPAAYCSQRSQPISIAVYDAVMPARIGRDTVICSGSAVLPFTEEFPNNGGTGSYTHQWQSSSGMLAFTDIPGAVSTAYQSPAISSTQYFRRADKSGNCAIAYSDTITVTTTAGALPGTIAAANGTICYNTVPAQPLINVTSASGGTGGTGSEVYQWQQSSDNINWTDIAGATSIDYSETQELPDTTYYRRHVIMGPGTCDEAYTTSVVLNVYAPFSVGSIGRDTAVCSGSSIRLTELIPAAGNNVEYQWIASTNKGVSWFDAPGLSTEKSYRTPGLNDSTWYKRIAFSSCAFDSSNQVTINVSDTPAVSAGTDTTVQKNSVIQLQGAVTGSVNYAWIPATRLSDPNILSPDALIVHTITYTLKATNVTGNCSAVSTVKITVEDPIRIPNVLTPNGDGTNDSWVIERIEHYPNASFIIFNRWGNIVWKASGNSFQWNGTSYRNGEALPDGTYFYIIDLNSNAYPEPYTGYIQLVR